MKLWLLSQETNDQYDTYDSMVVAAPDEASAKMTHPATAPKVWKETGGKDSDYGSWASKDSVQCVCIGEAVAGTEAGVICASFNAEDD
jgi:hypothetical protein